MFGAGTCLAHLTKKIEIARTADGYRPDLYLFLNVNVVEAGFNSYLCRKPIVTLILAGEVISGQVMPLCIKCIRERIENRSRDLDLFRHASPLPCPLGELDKVITDVQAPEISVCRCYPFTMVKALLSSPSPAHPFQHSSSLDCSPPPCQTDLFSGRSLTFPPFVCTRRTGQVFIRSYLVSLDVIQPSAVYLHIDPCSSRPIRQRPESL